MCHPVGGPRGGGRPCVQARQLPTPEGCAPPGLTPPAAAVEGQVAIPCFVRRLYTIGESRLDYSVGSTGGRPLSIRSALA